MSATLTPEQQAAQDLMLHHLREAVRLGFSICVPGEHDAVREAFPQVFATAEDMTGANPDLDEDGVSSDPHPMVSRGEGGHWVSAWVWIDRPEPKFINHYRCDRCGHEWQDEWPATCDDDCPACGRRHLSPFKSEDAEHG